ncbi:serine hydrolase domain-containing protein [Streptomyces sp. NPDC059881]|uniref:serine hydrolase domain-containing protein n=1 Tax=Streptomyces sp. NPDC059881 TaxID=3346986 RepID=UPI003666F232
MTQSRQPMVGGSVQPGWEAVRDAFAQGQATDPGAAQLAVHHQGRLVVDLWSTGTSPTRRPFGPESIGVLMSVTKGIVSVCTHLLSERGVLDLDAPVARYWPEYASAGKAGTTVADLLAHRAGLPAFVDHAEGVEVAGLLDRDSLVRGLAAMPPVWEPGSAYLYHALTYGHLIGEVVRRVTGMSIGAFFDQEVARPLGLDLWIGLPLEEEHRFVPQFAVEPAPTAEQIAAAIAGFGLVPDSPLALGLRAAAAELAAVIDVLGTRAGRASEIPAAGGIGNARSPSRLYAALIGRVDGMRVLSPLTVERARAPRTDRLRAPAPLDRLHGLGNSRFGLGFELPRPGEPLLGEGSFGHAGAGGRLGIAHPESGLAVGYVCTAMSWEPAAGPDPRWVPWTKAVQEAAGRN